MRRIPALAGLLLGVIWLAVPGPAQAAAPPAPTNVTVSWVPNPSHSDGPYRMVRVSWQEVEPEPNQVCVGAEGGGYCAETTDAAPNQVDIDVAEFFSADATRVCVVVTGAEPSAPACSADFDTLRPATPTITQTSPWIDGRVKVSWAPGPPILDPNAGDPLDQPGPAQFQIITELGAFAEAGNEVYEGNTATISAPDGVLLWMRGFNEWQPFIAAETGRGLGNPDSLWQSSLRSVSIPSTVPIGSPTSITGLVTADPWECFGMPPGCYPPYGVSPDHVTPSSGRTVGLQARNTPAGPWYAVGSTTSAGDGRFAFRVTAPGTREYRLILLGRAAPPAANPQVGLTGAAARTVSVDRAVSARFDPTPVAANTKVTARLQVASGATERATLQRWTGTRWTNVMYVYTTRGVGARSFTATRSLAGSWRFVLPASTSRAGLPVAGATSPTFALSIG